MPERTLANPLSGEEVRNAILDRIGVALQKDCFLSPNTAYDYFSATVKISVRCHDVGRTAEVEKTETVTLGEVSDDIHLDQAEAEFEIDAAPPNEVRVESGQPVPVATRDTEGKTQVKHVKYSRKVAEKAKA